MKRRLFIKYSPRPFIRYLDIVKGKMLTKN